MSSVLIWRGDPKLAGIVGCTRDTMGCVRVLSEKGGFCAGTNAGSEECGADH